MPLLPQIGMNSTSRLILVYKLPFRERERERDREREILSDLTKTGRRMASFGVEIGWVGWNWVFM